MAENTGVAHFIPDMLHLIPPGLEQDLEQDHPSSNHQCCNVQTCLWRSTAIKPRLHGKGSQQPCTTVTSQYRLHLTTQRRVGGSELRRSGGHLQHNCSSCLRYDITAVSATATAQSYGQFRHNINSQLSRDVKQH